jgi:hypothetical protein
MATTTNYSWTTPDDTALVKDGAAAIRSLGTAIDSTVFTNAGNAIAKSVVDAKGDLIVGTADNTVARLASSGVNGEVLQVDTSTATGLKYGAVAAGANWSLLNTGGTALTGAATITVSGISGKDKIMILVSDAKASAQSEIDFRFNGDTGNNYSGMGFIARGGNGTFNANNYTRYNNSGISVLNFARQSNSASDVVAGGITISGCNASGIKALQVAGGAQNFNSMETTISYIGQGLYTGTSTISSVSILSSVGNFTAGTIFVYTSA